MATSLDQAEIGLELFTAGDECWAPAWILALVGQINTCQITSSNRGLFPREHIGIGIGLKCKHCGQGISVPCSANSLSQNVVVTFLRHTTKKCACTRIQPGIEHPILALKKKKNRHRFRARFWERAWSRLCKQQKRLVSAGALGISGGPRAQASCSQQVENESPASSEAHIDTIPDSEMNCYTDELPAGTLALTDVAGVPQSLDASTEPAVDVGQSPHTFADGTAAMDIFGDEPPSLDEALPGSNYQDGVHLKAADLQQLLAEMKELKQNLHQLRNEQTEELRQLRFEFTNHAEKIQQVRDELIMGQQKICTRLDQLEAKIHSRDKNMDDVDGEGLGETPPQLRLAVSELYYI
jgi:hypothetical protein